MSSHHRWLRALLTGDPLPAPARRLLDSLPPPDDAAARRRILLAIPFMVMGGADRAQVAMIEGLRRRGDSFHVVTTSRAEHVLEPEYRAVAARIVHLGEALDRGSYEAFLVEYARRFAIDAVVVSQSRTAYRALPGLKRRLPGVRTADLLHALGSLPVEGGFPRFSAAYDAAIDVRLCVGEHLRSWLVRETGVRPEKARAIHNGVDLERFAPGRVEPARAAGGRDLGDARVVAFLGRFSPEKHVETVIATASILRARSDVVFVLAGGGPLEADLRRAVREGGLEERVVFAGVLADPRPLLRRASAVVLPSEHETMGLVLVEAMALGTPVVASRVGGIPEVVRDGEEGFLVPFGAGMEAEIARRIEAILDEPGLAGRLSAAGRERAKAFSIERSTDAYDEALRPGASRA